MKPPILTALLTFSTIAVATLAIDWSTIDAGGNTSSGGIYAVTGTIGQPDAGTMTGGTYTVTGGFWSMPEVVPVERGPALTVTQTGPSTVQLRWPAPSPGWRLESSTNLEGWAAVPGTPVLSGNFLQVPQTIVPGTPKQFYRLALP